MLNADDYAVDGYTLTMIDQDGNIGFDGGFMIPDDDIVITLSYTKEQEPAKSGCGSVAAIPAILSLAGVSMFLLKKKNKGEKR